MIARTMGGGTEYERRIFEIEMRNISQLCIYLHAYATAQRSIMK
jgi:hypothetical protein